MQKIKTMEHTLKKLTLFAFMLSIYGCQAIPNTKEEILKRSSALQLNSNTWLIKLNNEQPQNAQEMLLYVAAQKSKEQGYKYFTINQQETSTSTEQITPSYIQSQSTSQGTITGNTIQGSTTGSTTIVPGISFQSSRTSAVIKLKNENNQNEAYDAEILIKSISEKFKIASSSRAKIDDQPFYSNNFKTENSNIPLPPGNWIISYKTANETSRQYFLTEKDQSTTNRYINITENRNEQIRTWLDEPCSNQNIKESITHNQIRYNNLSENCFRIFESKINTGENDYSRTIQKVLSEQKRTLENKYIAVSFTVYEPNHFLYVSYGITKPDPSSINKIHNWGVGNQEKFLDALHNIEYISIPEIP